MNKLISSSFIFIILLGIILSFFNPNMNLNYSDYNIDENSIYTSPSGYTWPIPGFYKISSYFGNRNSPTPYSSSFHRGIDIPASENTYFLASISAKVIYTGFRGSGRLYNYFRKKRCSNYVLSYFSKFLSQCSEILLNKVK